MMPRSLPQAALNEMHLITYCLLCSLVHSRGGFNCAIKGNSSLELRQQQLALVVSPASAVAVARLERRDAPEGWEGSAQAWDDAQTRHLAGVWKSARRHRELALGRALPPPAQQPQPQQPWLPPPLLQQEQPQQVQQASMGAWLAPQPPQPQPQQQHYHLQPQQQPERVQQASMGAWLAPQQPQQPQQASMGASLAPQQQQQQALVGTGLATQQQLLPAGSLAPPSQILQLEEALGCQLGEVRQHAGLLDQDDCLAWEALMVSLGLPSQGLQAAHLSGNRLVDNSAGIYYCITCSFSRTVAYFLWCGAICIISKEQTAHIHKSVRQE